MQLKGHLKYQGGSGSGIEGGCDVDEVQEEQGGSQFSDKAS